MEMECGWLWGRSRGAEKWFVSVVLVEGLVWLV